VARASSYARTDWLVFFLGRWKYDFVIGGKLGLVHVQSGEFLKLGRQIVVEAEDFFYHGLRRVELPSHITAMINL